MYRTSFSTIACALVVCASGAFAQEQPDSAVKLPPVVVTATRVPTSIESVPATVLVLDGEQLRAEGIRHVAEALRRVPGLSVVQTGSFGSTTALFMRGGESNFVKVLVDGVPVNAPGGTFDAAHLTLDNVERIEVVRGPASVLYGSDAVSGVVQIFTQRGTGAPEVEAGFRGGTYSSFAGEVSLTGGVGVVQYGFGFARSTTDGILEFNNGYDNTVWSGSLRATPDDRTDVSLSVRYTDSQFHVPTDGSGNVVDRNAFGVSEQLSGALEVGHFFSERVEGRLLLTLNEFDGGFDDRSDTPTDTSGFFGFVSVQDLTRRGADGRMNLRLGGGTIVTTGAQIEEQKERSFNESMSEFGNSTGSLSVERINFAYYTQIHSTPLPALAVTVGGRVDENDEFGTFLTYRAGAAYRFPVGTRLRASVGRAFKEPTFFENFSTNTFALGNPQLEPERSVSWEVGAEQELLDGRVRFGVVYFEQRFQDLIQFTPTPPSPGAPNFFNVAEADAAGVEFEFDVSPVPNLDVRGSFTGLDTEVQDPGFGTELGDEFVRDSSLLRRPSVTYSGQASYRFRDRVTVGAMVRHVGERADRDFSTFPSDRVTLDAYTDVALSAEVELSGALGIGPTIILHGRIDNLFDETYQEAFGFRAPERRVTAGLRARF